MAERDFYNVNDHRSYPFIHDDTRSLLPAGLLPDRGLVDAGFTMGHLSGFEPGTDSVYLHSFVIAVGEVRFDFRSGAPGFSGRRFLFTIPAGTPAGATDYQDSVLITGGGDDPDYGQAFLTVGDLTEILALGDGTYTASGVLRVEPALIQTEHNAFVEDITVANKSRCCPESCTNPLSSSSSSSSSGAPEEDCDPDRNCIYASDLTGDILFREGNNITIQLDEENNAFLFDALVGFGEGESCEDVIIDGDGEANFHRGEFCLACDEVIKSINGHEVPEGRLTIISSPGVQVIPNAPSYEVGIILDTDKFCQE